jgi:hypothetical protein
MPTRALQNTKRATEALAVRHSLEGFALSKVLRSKLRVLRIRTIAAWRRRPFPQGQSAE